MSQTSSDMYAPFSSKGVPSKTKVSIHWAIDIIIYMCDKAYITSPFIYVHHVLS